MEAPALDSSGGGRTLVWVLLAGTISGLLYAVLTLASRALYRNGLDLRVAGLVVRGEPADASALVLQAGTYYGATAGLFAVYVGLIVACRRGLLEDRRARVFALAFPVLFNAGLLFVPPYASIDALTYAAHGYIGGESGANPYLVPAAQVGESAFGRQLAAYGWLPVHGPSPYGPLWTRMEVLVVELAGGATPSLLLLRGVVVAASLASAALVWRILARVRPEDKLLGTLVYLYNPVVVVEFAAEGHNDAVAIFFVLLSLLLAVAARPALSLGALSLGVLAKYLPVILLPANLVYLWHTRRSGVRLTAGLAAGLFAGCGLAVGFFWPFWEGPLTLDPVRQQGRPVVSPTLPGGLLLYLTQTRLPETAESIVLLTTGALFGLLALLVARRVRDATGLLEACAVTVLIYSFLVPSTYWPWYAALPIALLALCPRGLFLPLVLLISVASRAVSPVANLANNGFVGWETASHALVICGVAAPGAAALLLLALWLLASGNPGDIASPGRDASSRGPN